MVKEVKKRARKTVVTVTFKLPEPLLKTIDELVEKLGYTSRSDLIRDALRVFIRVKARELMEELWRVSQIGKKESEAIEEVKKID
jgi:metal-responsive CopG/Arc/MetJ family transcriptional regulator